MATTVIRNSILAGAMGGLNASRQASSFTPSDYAAQANIADAIATECITRNAALVAAMADADNAQIGPLCQMCAYAVCAGSNPNSTTATDWLATANQIVAMAKQAAAKLT